MSSKTQEFLDLFRPEEITPLFKQVAQQQFDHGQIICDGFYMGISRADDLKHFIPEDKLEAFKDQFILFAKATHSGSTIGFFRAAGMSNVDEYPLLVFGDEGGTLVLAEGLQNYLSFALLNVSPYITTAWEADKQDEFDLFEGEGDWDNADFAKWAKSQGIPSVNDIGEAKVKIIAPAQAKFQAEIDSIFKV